MPYRVAGDVRDIFLEANADKDHVSSGTTPRKPHWDSGSITSATCVKKVG